MVDYLPLALLGLVVIGAAVLFPFLRRLKRAAQDMLEASRGLETRLQSLQAPQARPGQVDPQPKGEGSQAGRDDRPG